jgi:hypothetical protein
MGHLMTGSTRCRRLVFSDAELDATPVASNSAGEMAEFADGNSLEMFWACRATAARYDAGQARKDFAIMAPITSDMRSDRDAIHYRLGL